MTPRELTAKEKREVCRLVKTMCANYDREYGCLLLDSECYMFGKAYTGGALCKWFRNALMPLDPVMGRLFGSGSGGDSVTYSPTPTQTPTSAHSPARVITPETKPCKICGRIFALNRRQIYCSTKCAKQARRKSDAEKSRRYRRRKREQGSVTI